MNIGFLRRRPGAPPSKSRPVWAVLRGAAIGQVALAASLPITARLYSPSEIGIFALTLTYCQLAAIFVTWRLEQVLPRVQLGERWAITRILLTLVVPLAPVAGLVVAKLAGQGGAVDIVSAGALCASVCLRNLATFTLLSEQQFGAVASLRVTNGVVTAAAQVVGGLILPEIWVLIAMYVFGDLAAACIAIPALRVMRRARSGVSLAGIWRRHHLGRFGASVGTGSVLSDVGLALPLIGVAALFGDAEAGSFWLARRLLMVPTQLVATSVSEVSYAMIALKSVSEMAALVHDWVRKAVFPSILLLCFGLLSAPLLPMVVGAGYQSIGMVLAILTLPSVAQMVATSFANVLLALHLESVRVVWNLVRVAGLFVLFGVAIWANLGFIAALAAYGAYMVAAYGLLLWLTLRGLRQAQLGPA